MNAVDQYTVEQIVEMCLDLLVADSYAESNDAALEEYQALYPIVSAIHEELKTKECFYSWVERMTEMYNNVQKYYFDL
jgi:hypothetical protein